MIAAAIAVLDAAARLFSLLRKPRLQPQRPEFTRFRFCLERRPGLDAVTQTTVVGDPGKAVENG